VVVVVVTRGAGREEDDALKMVMRIRKSVLIMLGGGCRSGCGWIAGGGDGGGSRDSGGWMGWMDGVVVVVVLFARSRCIWPQE